jgi:hypothetical protein
MRNFNLFLICLLTTATIASCSSSSDDDMEPIPTPSNITYTNTVKTIIDKNCTTSSCHDNNAPAAGLSFTTYDGVKIGFQSKGALSQIESGAMPKDEAKLPQATITKIKGWITNNYKE